MRLPPKDAVDESKWESSTGHGRAQGAPARCQLALPPHNNVIYGVSQTLTVITIIPYSCDAQPPVLDSK